MLGVSPDPVKRVKKFHDKQSLNFKLLADEDHAVAELYGVWAEKSMYGKTYFGNERTTFVIDATGKVTDVLRKVKPKEHDELVLAALARYQPRQPFAPKCGERAAICAANTGARRPLRVRVGYPVREAGASNPGLPTSIRPRGNAPAVPGGVHTNAGDGPLAACARAGP